MVNGQAPLAAVDSLGNLVLARSYGNLGNTVAIDITITPNGNLLICGSVTQPTQGGNDLLLLELSKEGDIVSATALGNSDN